MPTILHKKSLLVSIFLVIAGTVALLIAFFFMRSESITGCFNPYTGEPYINELVNNESARNHCKQVAKLTDQEEALLMEQLQQLRNEYRINEYNAEQKALKNKYNINTFYNAVNDLLKDAGFE